MLTIWELDNLEGDEEIFDIIDEAEDEALDLEAERLKYNLRGSKHAKIIRESTIECIVDFFDNKDYWAGGKIPKRKLLTDQHVDAVMDLTVMDGVAVAYYCLEKIVPENVDTSIKNWEIKLCMDCIRDCHNKFVPKVFIGGMLLLYLSMCHGVDFLPTLKKLSEIRAEMERREKEAELKQLIKEQQKDDDQSEP